MPVAWFKIVFLKLDKKYRTTVTQAVEVMMVQARRMYHFKVQSKHDAFFFGPQNFLNEKGKLFSMILSSLVYV